MNATISKQEEYTKLLTEMSIDTKFIDDEQGTLVVTTAFLPYHNTFVVIDESAKDVPPHAIHCTLHEGQTKRCQHMLAVDWYYQTLCEGLHKPKQEAIRSVMVEQNNRVEYQILRSDKQHYCTVQMVNGRASNCFYSGGDPLVDTCGFRLKHPGVPCPHMEVANRLESDHREQTRIAQVIASGDFKAGPEELQQLTQQEVAKCEEAYKAVMREPINEVHGTPEYWQSLKRRQRRANRAYRLQMEKSEQLLFSTAQEAA